MSAALPLYKPYPVYEDSGVEWLGQIPGHWEIARVSELAQLLNGYPFDSQHFVRGDGIPLVRIRDIADEETEVNYVGPVVENAWIDPGDIIIGMDGDFNVARWRGRRALLNQRMCCLRSRDGTASGFLAYVLPFPLKAINEITYSTTVRHLSSADIRKIRLGRPPQPEQRAIAAFLDRETARIDALVAKKERLIELLQEERTALISHAVTKGLDPNAPTKDSGVEWLGEIPAHWEVRRLKYLATADDESLSEGTDPDLELEYVDIGNVDAAAGIVAKETFTFAQAPSRARMIVREGDVIVSTVRTYLRAIAPITRPKGNLIVSTGFAVVRPESIDSGFAAFALRASYFVDRVVADSTGVSYPAITTRGLVCFPIAYPGREEQRAIAAFLDRETAGIDALVANVREGIERLREYRTALISAAVTGKIDVRNEAPVPE